MKKGFRVLMLVIILGATIVGFVSNEWSVMKSVIIIAGFLLIATVSEKRPTRKSKNSSDSSVYVSTSSCDSDSCGDGGG